MIVRQNTPRGGRQQSAFEEAWLVEGGELPERFWVRTPADWRRLFDILKEPERETAAVFAAGDAKFAAKTRNFAPQRHAVFASSAVNQGRGRRRLCWWKIWRLWKCHGLPDWTRGGRSWIRRRSGHCPRRSKDFLRWALTPAVRR